MKNRTSDWRIPHFNNLSVKDVGEPTCQKLIKKNMNLVKIKSIAIWIKLYQCSEQ